MIFRSARRRNFCARRRAFPLHPEMNYNCVRMTVGGMSSFINISGEDDFFQPEIVQLL